MMAAWDVRPVSEFLFLFFTGRGGSFLSPKEKEKNGGANTYAASSKGISRNQTVTQQSGHSLERKKEQADTELSASAGSAVQPLRKAMRRAQRPFGW